MDYKKYAVKIIWIWLPFAIVSTIFSFLAYAVTQQNYRQNANDPQIQMADTIALSLVNADLKTLQPPGQQIDIAQSLDAFAVIYDDSGTPLVGSGYLNGSLPTLPDGVFAYTREQGEDRITWQPEEGIRNAIVVKRVNAQEPGFVMTGRSLREVENRISRIAYMALVAWVASMVLTLSAISLRIYLRVRRGAITRIAEAMVS